jgi:4'-phosphopantetheinyl transferase EntD
MIEDLLPPEIACVAIRGDDLSAMLTPEEVSQLGCSVESRVREFTTARSCARRALGKLGLPASPILRGSNREPVWPYGVIGSITHCQGYRAAAVAMQLDILTVGIDAEIHDELPAGVIEQVVVGEECVWLAEAPQGVHWDRLLFSAKESVYKAWFPLTGRWLGFEDVAVTLEPTHGRFHARLLVPPPVVAGHNLTGFTGRFLIRDGLVLTAIALRRGQDLSG